MWTDSREWELVASLWAQPGARTAGVSREEVTRPVPSLRSGVWAVHNLFPWAPPLSLSVCKPTHTRIHLSPDTACGDVIYSAIPYVGFLKPGSIYIYMPSPVAPRLTESYDTYTHTEKCNRNLLLLQCFGLCTPTQGLYLVWSVVLGYVMFLLNHLDV